MKISISSLIKIFLALLLFICLLDMPYGYFQLVRFLALVGFAYLAYVTYQEGKNNEAYLFVALAVLFQPLIKIALGREIWNIIDVVVGAYLIYSYYRDRSDKDV